MLCSITLRRRESLIPPLRPISPFSLLYTRKFTSSPIDTRIMPPLIRRVPILPALVLAFGAIPIQIIVQVPRRVEYRSSRVGSGNPAVAVIAAVIPVSCTAMAPVGAAIHAPVVAV
jgi:hypothetical protein